MALILTIENEAGLPNGAPVSVRVADRRNFDIGRGAHLDWTLPDPTRFISGKHCEVRYRDDGYWIYDVSTNGTFLNDSPRRLQAPYRLCNGDRLTIGSYVILVTLENDEELAPEREIDAASVADRYSGERAAAVEEPSDEPGELAAGVPEAELVREADPPPPHNGTADSSPDPVLADAFSPSSAAEPVPFEVAAAREFPFEARSVSSAEADIAPFAPPPIPKQPLEPPSLPSEPDSAATEPQNGAADAGDRPSVRPPLAPHSPAPSLTSEAKVAITPQKIGSAPAPAASTPDGADGQQADVEEFLRRFAAGAGIPEHVFARRDRLDVAEELGVAMRLVAENLKQLLSARYEAKRFTRAASQTMIQALDNNPLKFAPTAEDALRIMLGPKTRSYLDARRSLEGAFDDLKTHQIKTFSAMQRAVKMLIDDFDPQQIDAAAGPSTGVGAWLTSRKARLWDLFVARWQAKSLRHKDGLGDAFMLYFSECYDRTSDDA